MRRSSLRLSLDPTDNVPMFLRIARALTTDIQRARLAPGDRLPGSRQLATTLGVHRNTVAAAYDELQAEGWLTSDERRGTFVNAELPERGAGSRGASIRARPLGFALPPAAPTIAAMEAHHAATLRTPRGKAVLHLAGGAPDLRLCPLAALARAYRHALRRQGPALVDYGDVRGHPRLRAELIRMLAEERGLVVADDELLITHGAQEALFLLGQLLGGPRARIAIEALGYPPAWHALAQRATLVPAPVDAHGLDVGALEKLILRRPIQAVYVTPHHQYPSMATLGASRRLALLELAARRGFAVIEDDYDHELHHEGRPVLPLASADRRGVVLYVGTLSKILAPGLRLGYLVAPRPVIERATALRRGTVRQGDLALEAAVATLFEDGEVQRHARRLRRQCAVRRQVLAEDLRARLGHVLEVTLPPGGMALWLPVAPDIDPEAWAEAALARGVVVAPGRRYRFDGRREPHLRVGYAGLNEAELVEAVRRLAEACPRPTPR